MISLWSIGMKLSSGGDRYPISATVVGAVLDEAIRPDMVRTFKPQPDARAIIQPEAAPLCLFLLDLQHLTSPDALNPLVVYTPARVVKQARDHEISVAPILAGKLDNVLSQPFFIRSACWNLPLSRAMLSQCAAGAALGYAQLLPHMIDAFAAT